MSINGLDDLIGLSNTTKYFPEINSLKIPEFTLAAFLPLSHSFSGKWYIYEGGLPLHQPKRKEDLWRSTGSWPTGNCIPLYSSNCLTPELNNHLFWNQNISNYFLKLLLDVNFDKINILISFSRVTFFQLKKKICSVLDICG